MLLIKTFLDKSPINGIGLYAKEFVPKGTVIWDFVEGFDKKIEVEKLPELDDVLLSFTKWYGYRDGENFVLCFDDARFMNHSSTPNTICGEGETTVTSADINIGDEITCDYYEFDGDVHNKFKDK